MTAGDDTPLGSAMRAGDRAALDRIARDRPGIARDAGVFLDAVALCPAATVRWCIDNGADPNLPADDGFTSLHLAIDRAGLVGADGATHAGSFDVAFLANLPGMVVMAAADEAELVHMVATAAAHNDGPIAFRYPRGEGVGVEMPARGVPLAIGKGRIIREGARVALLSFGTRLAEVQKAAEALVARGLNPSIADARFAKPLDRELILGLARSHEALITIEEGAIGGFASHVAQLLADEGVFDHGLKFRAMVLPDTFIDQASPEAMYRIAGMDAARIEAKVLETLGVAVVGRRA